MALAHLALVGWFDAVYYGRFANEHQAGIFIKRIGTIRTDYEYAFAIPTRPSQPGACEARAREGPFICDVRFVKIRSIHGLRREPGGWRCRTWAPAGQPPAGPRHLPLLEDLQLARTATSNGADPVRYRLAPAAPAAAAPPFDAGDDPMPPAAQDPADDIPAALRIAETHELAWTHDQAFVAAQIDPAADIPHDRIWAEVAEHVPGKSAFECEQLANNLIYFQPSEGVLPNFGWWDALDLEDASRSACPTFSHVPAEHVPEIEYLLFRAKS